MTQSTTKPRARRIAADEAHSWARNLRLRNPYAKLVLSFLTLYVNGDGTCFVGIGELSKDCELAQETVRRRLVWLESVGAVTRMPQWIDENGRRNSDGRGKRTTDEIRLMIDADADAIEARACGDLDAESEGDADGISPVHGRGLNSPEPTVGPVHGEAATDDEKAVSPPVSPLAAPSLRTGPDSSEPEPEVIPPTPLRGEGHARSDHEGEGQVWQHAETWARFETAWQEPILHQQLCRQIWTAFTEPERETAIKVARGYVKWRSGQKRPPNACNAQKILREREAWPRFIELAGPDPALRTFIVKESPEYHALAVLEKIGGWSAWPLTTNPLTGDSGYWRSSPVPPDILGLAVFADRPVEEWQALEPDTKQFFAWSSRIFDWVGKRRSNLRVPCPLPPRKDGSIGPADASTTANDDSNISKTG